MRPLAHAKALAARRRNNERVGLLVVAIHEWDAGRWFEAQPSVSRVVLPDDVAVHEADWSVCLALDVVLCGRCPDEVFNAAARAVMAAGAASVWGDYADGLHLIEALGARSVVAVDGPFTPEKLGAALRRHREAALVLGLGGYASRLFAPARAALVDPLLAALSASLAEV